MNVLHVYVYLSLLTKVRMQRCNQQIMPQPQATKYIIINQWLHENLSEMDGRACISVVLVSKWEVDLRIYFDDS